MTEAVFRNICAYSKYNILPEKDSNMKPFVGGVKCQELNVTSFKS